MTNQTKTLKGKRTVRVNAAMAACYVPKDTPLHKMTLGGALCAYIEELEAKVDELEVARIGEVKNHLDYVRVNLPPLTPEIGAAYKTLEALYTLDFYLSTLGPLRDWVQECAAAAAATAGITAPTASSQDPNAQPQKTNPEGPNNDALTWLYGHCKALGMNCKSLPGTWEGDIALWVEKLQLKIFNLESSLQTISCAYNNALATAKQNAAYDTAFEGYRWEQFKSSLGQDFTQVVIEYLAWMALGHKELSLIEYRNLSKLGDRLKTTDPKVLAARIKYVINEMCPNS